MAKGVGGEVYLFFSDSIVPALKARVLAMEFVKSHPRVASVLDHPAGPFTIHFWAPTCKWLISLANLADYQRPPELISVPQQIAVTATGVIWSRYSFVITPVNYNLFAVNAFMAVTGGYQLYRRFRWEQEQKKLERAVE